MPEWHERCFDAQLSQDGTVFPCLANRRASEAEIALRSG